jgi:hypothetical protein
LGTLRFGFYAAGRPDCKNYHCHYETPVVAVGAMPKIPLFLIIVKKRKIDFA